MLFFTFHEVPSTTNVFILTTLDVDDQGLRNYFASQLRKYSSDLDGVTFFASINGVTASASNKDALSMAKFLETTPRLPAASKSLESELLEDLAELDFVYGKFMFFGAILCITML